MGRGGAKWSREYCGGAKGVVVILLGKCSKESVGLRVGAFIYMLVLIIAAANVEEEQGMDSKAGTAACALLMVIYWLTEALPLAVTSLLPIILLPAAGVAPASTVSSAYFSDPILLFFGTFILAAAVESYGLHRRAALKMLAKIGTDSPPRVLLAFTVTTAFLSMWLNNTATAAMMMPLATAVLEQMKEGKRTRKLTSFAAAEEQQQQLVGGGSESVTGAGEDKEIRALSAALALGVAYAASLGGLATLTGTGPNIILQGALAVGFPDGPDLSFIAWFCMVGPVAWLGVAVLWILLTARFLGGGVGGCGRYLSLCLPGYGAATRGGGLWRDATDRRRAAMRGERHASEGWLRNDWLKHQAAEDVDRGRVGNFAMVESPLRAGKGGATTAGAPTDPATTTSPSRAGPAGPPPAGAAAAAAANDVPFASDVEVGTEVTGESTAGAATTTTIPSKSTSSIVTGSNGAITAMKEPMTWAEQAIVGDFVVLVLLWILRDPHYFPGWSSLLPVSGFVSDGTVAMFAAMVLFIVPKEDPFGREELAVTTAASTVTAAEAAATGVVAMRPTDRRLGGFDEGSEGEGQGDEGADKYGVGEEDADAEGHIYPSQQPRRRAGGRRRRRRKRQHQLASSEDYDDTNAYGADDTNAYGANAAVDTTPNAARASGVGGAGHGSGGGSGRKAAVLEWEVVSTLPWEVIFLLGGGYALSVGFNESGLSTWIADAVLGGGDRQDDVDDVYDWCKVLNATFNATNVTALNASFWANVSALVDGGSDGDGSTVVDQDDDDGFSDDSGTFYTILVLAILLSSGMSNLVSNVATANIFLPLLCCIAVRPNRHPWMMLVPCTAACSCAFLFPIGTPPNAIGYGTGFFTIGEMATTGAILTVALFGLIAFAVEVTIPATINADSGSIGTAAPQWARDACR